MQQGRSRVVSNLNLTRLLRVAIWCLRSGMEAYMDR